ncbi:MAG: 30S ribosomal protein S11 [Kiritimatiellae bacterium]|nr:30S ribosomal protein S11 [Kiritimatiellia bacterium]
MAEEKEQKEVKAPAAEAVPAEAAPAPAEGAAPAEGEAAAKPVKRKAVKGQRSVPVGIVYVRATFNNTMVTITDMRGAVVCWSTAGRCGFKGSRKSTAYAATVVAQEAARQAVGFGMHEVEVRIQGPGAGRESAIRAIQSAGLTVTVIKDITPVPHNGCRPPKRRRV